MYIYCLLYGLQSTYLFLFFSSLSKTTYLYITQHNIIPQDR